MSIFGTTYPYIYFPESDDSLSLTNEIGGDLPANGIVLREPDKFKRDVVVNKSIITGKKNYHYKGKHVEFSLTVINAGSDIIEMLTQMEGEQCIFYPHHDNENRMFTCFLSEVTPFYHKRLVACDSVKIKMETKYYWEETAATIMDATGNHPKGIFEGTLVDESGNFIVDELGNRIIINENN